MPLQSSTISTDILLVGTEGPKHDSSSEELCYTGETIYDEYALNGDALLY